MLYIVVEQSTFIKSYLGRIWDHTNDREHDKDRPKRIQKTGDVSITTFQRGIGLKKEYRELCLDKWHEDR